MFVIHNITYSKITQIKLRFSLLERNQMLLKNIQVVEIATGNRLQKDAQ